MMSTPAILLRDVHKWYGQVYALRGLDLEVPVGAIFGFLGPNGAGKTTTIRCLLDLIRPQRGEIQVLGLDVRVSGEGTWPRPWRPLRRRGRASASQKQLGTA